MKILIAEDDALSMKIMEWCLKKEGYEVICTIDGIEAMEKINFHQPDLILVDIMLPYFSGLEILSKVKQNGITAPVIVISAMGQQDVIDEALKLGAYGYISKPFNMNELGSYIMQITGMAISA